MIEESVLRLIEELRTYADGYVAGVDRRITPRFHAVWPVLIRGAQRDFVTETADLCVGGLAVQVVLEIGENVEAQVLITPDTVLRFEATVMRVEAGYSGLRITCMPPIAARRLVEMSALAELI